jgi:GDP-mannose 6-dehydrogenase
LELPDAFALLIRPRPLHKTLNPLERTQLNVLSVSVFGLGYVGSVTAACLSSLGHKVIGVDINKAKCDMINSGKAPIVEARLGDLIKDAHSKGRLRATTDIALAVNESDISFVSVGTPGLRNGKLDVNGIERVCFEIGDALRSKSRFHTVVLRSTVLPGTTETVVIPALERSSGKLAARDFGVSMNPEFMREGTAVADFFDPPLTVIGASTAAQLAPLRELYSFTKAQFFETSLGVAEMVKYTSNCYHAAKVAFANEIGTLCRQMGVDPYAVAKIFTADTKLNISTAYLTPGFAFGGSCLPKDVRALAYRAKELDVEVPLLGSLMSSNNEHVERAVEAILDSGKRKIGVLGLSFKTGTDDLRESPSVQLIKRLIGEGCQVRIWDPEVALGRLIGSNRQFIEENLPHIASLLCDSLDTVVREANVVVIGTKATESANVRSILHNDQLVFDLLKIEYSSSARTAAPANLA